MHLALFLLLHFASLHWTQSGKEPVQGYIVYRSTQPDTGFQILAELAGNELGYDDHTVTVGRFYYRVTAYNKAGATPSNTVEVVVP
jgi:hypothetical protein